MPRRPTTDLSTLPYYLCVDEVASLVRLTRKAVYGMIHRGQLPGAIKVGERIRIKRDDLLAWLDTL